MIIEIVRLNLEQKVKIGKYIKIKMFLSTVHMFIY